MRRRTDADAVVTWNPMFGKPLASAIVVALVAAIGCGSSSGKNTGTAGTTGGAGLVLPWVRALTTSVGVDADAPANAATTCSRVSFS